MSLGSKYSEQVKELQTRLEEWDEELATERNNRAKTEKNRSMLKKDIEDVASRLEGAGSDTKHCPRGHPGCLHIKHYNITN